MCAAVMFQRDRYRILTAQFIAIFDFGEGNAVSVGKGFDMNGEQVVNEPRFTSNCQGLRPILVSGAIAFAR